MNDIPNIIQGTAKLFADDMNVFDKACKKDTLQKDLLSMYGPANSFGQLDVIGHSYEVNYSVFIAVTILN